MNSRQFKQRREALRWTQAEASEALGITVAQISAIENNRSRVTRTVAMLLGAYRPFDPPGRPGRIIWTAGEPMPQP